MQKTVMRVRGSFGLKFSAELRENGSARIETDSMTTARVEVAETLKSCGLFWIAPNAFAKAPQPKMSRSAEVNRRGWFEVKARSLIKQQRLRLSEILS
jgi:hypothetical protein